MRSCALRLAGRARGGRPLLGSDENGGRGQYRGEENFLIFSDFDIRWLATRNSMFWVFSSLTAGESHKCNNVLVRKN